jgi:hypothetical protein
VCAHVLLNPFEGLRIPSRGPWRVGIEYFGVGGTLYCTGNTLDTISRSVRYVLISFGEELLADLDTTLQEQVLPIRRKELRCRFKRD